jgi:hypothetical protein
MMVQRRDEQEDYVPRRKVIMMISSESSDEDYTPKKPSENNEKEKQNQTEKKKSEVPIKTEKNCESECSSSSAPLPKQSVKGKEPANAGTSTFTTPSSDSESSSESSSDSSSSDQSLEESPETKRIRKAKMKSRKKAKKRAGRSEQTASHAHEREQIGLALQQQHHLLDKVTERLGSQKETLDKLTAELVAVRAKAEESRKKREEEFRQLDKKREVERHRMLEDSRRREEGYKKMYDESVKRAQERKDMLSGLDNYAEIQRARTDLLRKDKRADSCARKKRKRAEKKRDDRKARLSPKALNLQSSSVNWEEPEDNEELDYLFLVKVKKGEKRIYTQFLLNKDKKLWEGPFALDTPIHHLIRHNNMVHPDEDSWRLTRDKEVLSSAERTNNNTGETYQGFSKAIRGKGIPGVGLKELLESERRKKEKEELNKNIRKKNKDVRESRKDIEGGFFEVMTPRFRMGQRVFYFVQELGNEKWHSSRVIGITYPGEDDHPSVSEQIRYTLQPDKEAGQVYENVNRKENELRDWSWAKPCLVVGEKNEKIPLVPLDLVGIDTCSALSVSSRREDFLWLDTSLEAKRSIILRGVGGDSTRIGGRGPMVVAGRDIEGKEVLIFDPAAVYLDEKHVEADFRIFGQQRLKAFGFNLQQQDECRGGDVLSYNNGKTIIPLLTNAGILTLQTHKRKLSDDQSKLVEETIDGVLKGEDGLHYCIPVSTSLIMNEAYLSEVEAKRLLHWRIAHRSLGKYTPNENCPVCAEGKKKTGNFKRNYEFMGSTRGEAEHYWRLYCDGYGGQHSMGDMSYQGGIGGFVFACPRGSVKIKLYGTSEQFPSILFQILQEIESEGYVARELYVDTHSVNLSKAAEEVAAMYRVRIIPISAGTPQEMAYAESAVRVIGQMGRTLMCGAPHLPAFCWGLADLYAVYIHNLLPQTKTKISPYEGRTGRSPDLDLFFVKVFGAPCQYAPIEGGEHKRAKKTEWGWFVGMQMPMVLVLRPEDEKILSVSRKKIIVHEEYYAKFDWTSGGLPLNTFSVPVLDLDEIKTANDNLETIREYKDRMKIPDHVLSIKSLSDYRKHPELNEPTPPTRPSPAMMKQLTDQPIDQGENTTIHVPEHEMWNKDLLQEKIRQLREAVNKHYDKGGKVEAIVKALKRAEEEASNGAVRRHILKKRSKFKDGQKVSKTNILPGKRRNGRASESGGDNPRPVEETGGPVNKMKRKRTQIDIGDRVKIKTKAFGKGYAEGKPTFTYGYVRGKKGDLYEVEWDAGDSMMTHKRHLSTYNSESEGEGEEPKLNGRITKETILPILSVGTALSQPNPTGKDSWPRDFYEALLRDDWRDWVQAVKNETDSWNMLDASTEIPYEEMERGASIIPLGELFSVKRSGKYKFRQYALGNMLKEGKDYGETFSSTVSGDGVRWFCALACSCKKEIRGWDATTGYLQTQQRVTVYAYLPSHHGFSELSFEELAPFRRQLKDMEMEEGIKSVKDFARRMKRERRERPKTVLRLNKSVYGIPDAGQSFSMFMQGLHLKHCKMIQSEMDPCIFYKILEDDKGCVTSYLIVITWVDDCRFFGTKDLVDEYEKVISKNCKCTLEGTSKEFVSIQICHRVEEGVLELTQQDYWVNAVERFKKFLPSDGPKERKVPLSPADERLLVEPTEMEMKDAEHLPYASLLGVCQYPSSFTKLEMRYAMSVLSRHRTKWGLNHFKVLIKALEYGFTTRHLGLRYDGNLSEKEINVLVGFADSAFTVPRSQGCRNVVMNRAAISLTSKKHTTTDDSTTAAELTECHLCACDVMGFRELMKEIGLEQKGPTVIFQDNQAAIQIAMNRGSLSKKTRAMDVRVFSVRNKIEDMQVVPIYLETKLMLADIGTKALEPAQFISLRDQLCGYAPIQAKW